MITGFSLEEAVREARAATGVPGIAVGLLRDGETALAADGVLELGREEEVRPETPFRIASVTKPFTATLCALAAGIDDRLSALLSHTAGLRCETADPLPAAAAGLWSYSNAGYWQAAAAACAPSPFDEAMAQHVLEPLELAATGFDEPPGCARGHVQQGESGHRAVAVDAYPVVRRPSGGLWSTVGDLLRFAAYQLDDAPPTLHEPRGEALGARYALGWWVREHADGRTTLDHEGSVAGYQSLLLLVPGESVALAVLTNSWRGSGAVRRIVEKLGLLPRPVAFDGGSYGEVAGTYALDSIEASVEVAADGIVVVEAEIDPVTGTRRETRFPARAIGDRVFGFAHGTLMGHRLDFPRSGLARVGWTVLPRVER
jgi:CubicO group peptidase (beta-lactamase class C family)